MTSSPNKAPGPDRINFKCIQQAYSAVPHHFNAFYKATMTAGYHPHIWREATIVIIKKPNKPDHSIPKAYRPVSLLNCLGKVLEKIMATRLAYLAERYGLLHQWQIGGRPKRSAVDACMLVASIVDEAKRKGKVVSALFMDVKGAFDNVSKDRLMHTAITAYHELLRRKGYCGIRSRVWDFSSGFYGFPSHGL